VKPLVLFSPWFGPWPSWINLYLVSCAANPEVGWVIPTDQAPPECRPDNVRFLQMTFAEFAGKVAETVGMPFAPGNFYKVVDVKPMLGHVFEAETQGYRSWGFADIDVIFGNIRRFYDDATLERYAAISTHANMLGGHFAVFRNSAKMRTAYRRRPRRWREAVASPHAVAFDERGFGALFKSRKPLQRLFAIRPALFVERFSTVDGGPEWEARGPQFPSTWLWKDGTLRTREGGDREFLYLHFMNWRSQRYRSFGRAPWPELGTNPVRIGWREAERNGFAISPLGFTSLDSVTSAEDV